LTEARFLHVDLGAGARHCCAERIRIDAEQHVAGLDALTLVVAALEQDARHARTDLDFADPFELSRILEHQRQRSRRDVDDADLDRRRRRHRGRLVARRERERQKAEAAPHDAVTFLCRHVTDSLQERAAPRSCDSGRAVGIGMKRPPKRQ
jgi:hypothetical protein